MAENERTSEEASLPKLLSIKLGNTVDGVRREMGNTVDGVRREYIAQRDIAALELEKLRLKEKQEEEYDEEYFRRHPGQRMQFALAERKLQQDFADGSVPWQKPVAETAEEEEEDDEEYLRSSRTQLAMAEKKLKEDFADGSVPTQRVAETAVQLTHVEEVVEGQPARPHRLRRPMPSYYLLGPSTPAPNRPINYDVVVQSYQGDKFPMIMVRNTMHAVVLPGKFNVMVSQDNPQQLMTATLEYARRKARTRKNVLGSNEHEPSNWELFRGFLVGSERSETGQVSNLYEPFEFHEDQTGAAAEVVVQFFMALAIPCTQTRRCPRCRLQAKGSLRSSMNAAPNGEHSHRVIATQRNVHTRKSGPPAAVRRLRLVTAKRLLEMGAIDPVHNPTHAAWLDAYHKHPKLPPRELPPARASGDKTEWMSASSAASIASIEEPASDMRDMDSFHEFFTPAKTPAFSSRRGPQSDNLLEEDSTETPSGEQEQALQMMEEALEIMNRAMEERTVAQRMCSEMRMERDAAIAAARGVRPPATSAEPLTTESGELVGSTMEELRNALLKQNELVTTLRASLNLMVQDYTDVRCENEMLRNDLHGQELLSDDRGAAL